MLEWSAITNGFPNCIVMVDSWFEIGPFIKGLKRLKLGYVVEVKNTYTVRTPCKKTKLTPKGSLVKNQYLKCYAKFKSIAVIGYNIEVCRHYAI